MYPQMGGSLAKFLLRRLATVAGVVVLVTTLTWVTFHGLRPEYFAYDDRHVLVQLGDYLQRAFLHFDLGNSWEGSRPEVADMVKEGLPADLWLLAGGLAFGLVAGMAAGAVVAARPRTRLARAIETVSMVFLCAPVYVVGLGVLLLFGDEIGLVDLGIPLRYVAFEDDAVGWALSLVVPSIVLGLPLAAGCQRMMTVAMRDIAHEEYIRTAYAKGLRARTVVRRHEVPASAAPVFSLAGVSVPVMVTNMVLVELTFSVPGIFQEIRTSMAEADFPVIQGTVIAAAFLVAVSGLVVDFLLAWLDPRVREAAAT
jgi:peptide/nickel transport system permease protein